MAGLLAGLLAGRAVGAMNGVKKSETVCHLQNRSIYWKHSISPIHLSGV
jgi:hypothetical protein